jgi:hypothetical protein
VSAWPLSGRPATLNTAAYCAPVSCISAGHHENRQVSGARDTVYGSEGWGFESLRACPRSEPLSASGRGSFANALAVSGTLGGGRYGAGEDVGSLGELVADDVRVHPQRDRGIGMAEPGGDHAPARQPANWVVAWTCLRSSRSYRPAWSVLDGGPTSCQRKADCSAAESGRTRSSEGEAAPGCGGRLSRDVPASREFQGC